MKITALIENRKADNWNDLETEHGLSLHIDHNNLNILFDTGASGAFEQNAAKLNIDLKQIDLTIISHHHYDHGGGLKRFLEINKKSKIYLGKRPSGELLFKELGGLLKKYIGLDRDLFEKYPDRFLSINQMAEIAPGLFILTDICKKYPRPKGNSKLMAQNGENLEPDRFDHELITVLKDRGELVILTGCAHSGILNMVETVVRNFPGTPIKAVVGGFHLAGIPVESLMAESRLEIEQIAAQMLKYPIKRVYTGHCTGMKGYEILKSVMGDSLEYISTGTSITI